MSAGTSLKETLNVHNIPQNHLAKKMGVARSTVSQWVNGVADPLSASIPAIVEGLSEIEPEAGQMFLESFLYGLDVVVSVRPA